MKTRKGYKVYPLTAAQKFHFFYLKFSPKKEVLNIGTSLTIQIDIDWNVLKESIYKAYDRSECMRVRFVCDKDETWYQYVVEKEDKRWNVSRNLQNSRNNWYFRRWKKQKQ